MKRLIKPAALTKGDTIATVSLSWGGAGAILSRYEQGKKQIEDTFGLTVIAAPNSLKSECDIYNSPQMRLDDLLWAFQNKNVKAIMTNIGGNDTIRLLPLMTNRHFDIIRNNPKIFLGMSDTTVNHMMCYKAGIASFYSPSTMFGFAENGGIPKYIIDSVIKTLFSKKIIGEIPQNPNGFIVEHIAWETNGSIPRHREPHMAWRFIQGTDSPVSGRLFGGCLDVIGSMLFGTTLWPSSNELEGCVLFLETSEDKPTPAFVSSVLRGLGGQGVLERLSGILFARPGGEFKNKNTAEKIAYLENYAAYDDALVRVTKEFGRSDMPIITRMDFGHTVPQMILPYGCFCRIDMNNNRLYIDDYAVV